MNVLGKPQCQEAQRGQERRGRRAFDILVRNLLLLERDPHSLHKGAEPAREELERVLGGMLLRKSHGNTVELVDFPTRRAI